MGGRTVDVRENCVLVRFGEREYMIGVQEVGIWGRKNAAAGDASTAKGKSSLSFAETMDRVRARELRNSAAEFNKQRAALTAQRPNGS